MKTSNERTLNLRTAMEVLENPLRIYHGIRDPRTEERSGWCYIGKPPFVVDYEGRKIAFPDGKLYTVFLNERYDVIDWGKENEDPQSSGRLRDEELGTERSRFGELVWQNGRPI